MVDAFGSIAWWGFSPSLDLLDCDNTKESIKHGNIH